MRAALVLTAFAMAMAQVFVPVLGAPSAPAAATDPDRTETIADAKGSHELVYRGNALSEERIFDGLGALLEERLFGSDSLPEETRTYLRAGGRVIKIEAKDASGDPVGSRTYRYDREGRLLGVSSEGSLGEGSAGMIARAGMPQGAWVSSVEASAKASSDSVNSTVVLGYDDQGRADFIQTMQNGTVASIEKRVYGDGGTLDSVLTEDRSTGQTSELSYDEKGRLSTRVDSPAKGAKQRFEYFYDDAGRLIEEQSFKLGHRSSRALSYGPDGKLSREERRKDGEIILAQTFIENGRIEELYEDGAIFVRATYIGGRKTKDEFFSEGVLVRTREY